ncbi:hypothetical protein SCALIN_C01_0233 [Candidatus Scalindua japonica]|uniref:Uncharacterized protein n=1 Tax=Candidatus Scalindua japonica TaxID=1284222 RepID=A0A286TTU3_9BACT|nr:hypothetical protein SCALIN_C01_0233 [Candidatus Scalindua japonica]
MLNKDPGFVDKEEGIIETRNGCWLAEKKFSFISELEVQAKAYIW